ncbi:hypothetical protein ACT3SP_14195 [Brachybacterium sp. AOP43-C2-M15]|uniref:hypothetical protein n=1 Tax=Brachybacterium sp. AOP43-C2-M15 TaxID=3457661 RepID=UPI0040337C65
MTRTAAPEAESDTFSTRAAGADDGTLVEDVEGTEVDVSGLAVGEAVILDEHCEEVTDARA